MSREDCLYLNIWAPEWPPQAKRSVMVWITGGGNYYGAASDRIYDGESLARRGVVLVSPNYRLGAFGFFAHPALSHESAHHASGNQGILDQIAALRWVRNNIGTFGGDPDNVTIFGESAGSLDVSVLMASPLTKGLFRRVIAESGAVIGLGTPLTLHVAEGRGSAFASKLGAQSGASLKDLRAVSAEQIIQAQSGFDPNDPRSLEIVVDGYVFPDDPAHVFAAGREHRVGLIVGNNAREHVLTLPPDLRKAIEQAYGPLAARGLTLYGVGGPESATPDPFYGTPAEQWGTDTTFRRSAVAQLAWHAASRESRL
jgi:para-nitrobenzyl esterase